MAGFMLFLSLTSKAQDSCIVVSSYSPKCRVGAGKLVFIGFPEVSAMIWFRSGDLAASGYPGSRNICSCRYLV